VTQFGDHRDRRAYVLRRPYRYGSVSRRVMARGHRSAHDHGSGWGLCRRRYGDGPAAGYKLVAVAATIAKMRPRLTLSHGSSDMGDPRGLVFWVVLRLSTFGPIRGLLRLRV